MPRYFVKMKGHPETTFRADKLTIEKESKDYIFSHTIHSALGNNERIKLIVAHDCLEYVRIKYPNGSVVKVAGGIPDGEVIKNKTKPTPKHEPKKTT